MTDTDDSFERMMKSSNQGYDQKIMKKGWDKALTEAKRLLVKWETLQITVGQKILEDQKTLPMTEKPYKKAIDYPELPGSKERFQVKKILNEIHYVLDANHKLVCECSSEVTADLICEALEHIASEGG